MFGKHLPSCAYGRRPGFSLCRRKDFHRISQLAEGDQAWLKVVKDDGRIRGVTNPMGTTSSRAAHMAPNLGRVVSTLPAWALYGVVTKSERMTEIAKHADHIARRLLKNDLMVPNSVEPYPD
jgi:hypothetical protein